MHTVKSINEKYHKKYKRYQCEYCHKDLVIDEEKDLIYTSQFHDNCVISFKCCNCGYIHRMHSKDLQACDCDYFGNLITDPNE